MNTFLIFHTFVELLSVAVAWGILMVAWNARRFQTHSFFVFLGAAIAAVGMIDLVHVLAFKGMNVFAGFSANEPTQLWIAARYMQAVALLAAPLFLTRQVRVRWVVLSCGAAAVVLTALVFAGRFPDCFREGAGGLTAFKVVSEYVICGLVVGAIVHLRRRRDSLDASVYRLLLVTMTLTIATELSFTLYTDVYGFFNILGHLFKIAAFTMLYRAVVVTGLWRPYEVLYRDLSQSEERYRSLVSASPDAVLVHADGRLLYANAAAVTLFGAADFDSLAGQPILSLMAGAETAPGGGDSLPTSAQTINRLDGRRVPVEVRVSPVEYGGRSATQVILRDLSPHLKAEQDLQQFNAELRKSRAAALNLLQDAMVAREQAERAEAALRAAHDQLEMRVKQRTAELAQTVESLEDEVIQRIRAEKAAEIERKRFEDVLEMLPAYAILLTPDYHVAYANRTFREWFGDDKGKRCYEFLFDRTEPCEACETYTVLKTRQPHFWEWTGPNGCNYDIYDYPFTDTDGSPLIMEIGLDVTAHKQAQEAVRLGEERYRSLATATTQIIWTTDPHGQVVDDMPSWRAFTGQTVEDTQGWGWIESLHPEDRERTAEVWNYSVDHKTLYKTEYRMRRHDGAYRYMSVRGVPVLEPDGSIREWVGTCTDITERKAAEEALRSSSLYARGLLEASLDPLVTISPEGTITDVNRATELATGRSRQILIGSDFSASFTEPEKAEEGYQQVLAEGVVRDYPLTIRHASGATMDVLYNATVYKNAADQAEGVFATARDVTEHNKMEARTFLISGLHELFTKKSSRKDYLDSVVKLLAGWSGCRCVGIRLTDSEGSIPYASYVGFSDDFLATENGLSLQDDSCLCIRAITQTPNAQDIPLVTPNGAFCCENTFRFIETLSAEEKTRYRGHCMRHGFASLAVVPVRYRESILGAIHLADPQEKKVPLEQVKFIESIAMLVGEAVHRFDIEAELRDSEERYRQLVELSPEGIGIVQNDTLVFVNSTGAKLLGYDRPDDLIGRAILDLVHPDSRKRLHDELHSLKNSLKPLPLREDKLCRVDGTEIDAEIAATTLLYQNKLTIQIVFHDITQRKRQQQALQLSEARLLEAQRVGHLGNWEFYLSTNALWWSDEVYRIFGLSPQQFAATYDAFLSYVHPEDRALVEGAVEAALYDGKRYSIDHRVIRPDGVERVVHEQAEIVYDADHKQPVRMAGTVHDITDRVRAEEVVRQSEERFRLMANASEDVFWMSTPGIGQMLYISPAYEKLWGKTRKSLYQNPKSFLEAVHPDDRDRLVEGVKGHAEGVWNFEYRVLRADGDVRWVHDVGYPVFGEHGELRMMTGSIRDITAQKKSEAEILGKQKELRSLTAQLQLVEERERRQIAQDIHDSIGQILAFSAGEIKLLQKTAPEPIAESLRVVTRQLDLAVEQARSLSFDLSPSLLYDLGLEVAIEDMADKMSKERKIKCSFKSCSAPKPLTDDVKVLLYRSVRELVINSAKHAQAGAVKISCLRTNADICITVEDNGRGFDVSMLENRTGSGKGFGLFSLRERLSHIGGSLKIESEEGKGTTATLIAPLDIDRDP